MDAIKLFFKEKKNSFSQALIISDQHVFPLYGPKLIELLENLHLNFLLYLLSPGEESKAFNQAAHCWQEMHHHHFDRNTLVIGLGGGVVTDLAGFVASCYMRGVNLIHIPTTLLGMVDASIGGKTAVNLPTGKNIVGTFYFPQKVFIIPEWLKSLPKKELSSGMAEVIKYGVIQDAELFYFLESNMYRIFEGDEQITSQVIETCCRIKEKIVQEDREEKGIRATLNYGHTFAHAIETATEYKKYLHGEAVAIGMHCAAHVSHKLGYVDDHFILRQKNLCQLAHLPTKLPDVSNETLVQLMRGDKKSKAGKISLIVPKKIGKVIKIDDVNEDLIKEAIETARQDGNR